MKGYKGNKIGSVWALSWLFIACSPINEKMEFMMPEEEPPNSTETLTELEEWMVNYSKAYSDTILLVDEMVREAVTNSNTEPDWLSLQFGNEKVFEFRQEQTKIASKNFYMTGRVAVQKTLQEQVNELRGWVPKSTRVDEGEIAYDITLVEVPIRTGMRGIMFEFKVEEYRNTASASYNLGAWVRQGIDIRLEGETELSNGILRVVKEPVSVVSGNALIGNSYDDATQIKQRVFEFTDMRNRGELRMKSARWTTTESLTTNETTELISLDEARGAKLTFDPAAVKEKVPIDECMDDERCAAINAIKNAAEVLF